jgi:hypothetical protein
VIRSPEDIAEIKLCDGTACGHGDHDGLGNIADVTLAPGVAIPSGARRNFLTTSACGICGKTSVHDICVLPQAALADDAARFGPSVLATPSESCATPSGYSPERAACTPPGVHHRRRPDRHPRGRRQAQTPSTKWSAGPSWGTGFRWRAAACS